MTVGPGALSLQTPEDLMGKLLHDYDRIRANPLDSYAAFDFFITSNHYFEWLRKFRRPTKHLLRSRRDKMIYALVGQIANGAKHFHPKPDPLGAVDTTTKRETWVQPGWMQSDMYDRGALILNLEGAFSHEFGLSIEVLSVADELMQILQRQP